MWKKMEPFLSKGGSERKVAQLARGLGAWAAQ